MAESTSREREALANRVGQMQKELETEASRLAQALADLQKEKCDAEDCHSEKEVLRMEVRPPELLGCCCCCGNLVADL